MNSRKIAPVAAWLAGIGLTVTALCMIPGQMAQAGPTKQVGPWDAMKAAVTKVPGGKAISATYAFEEKHWIYDVIVVKGKAITEVEVDAATGKAGDTESVTPEMEGREMTAELNAAIGNKATKAPAGAEKDEKDEKGEKPGA